MHVEFVRELDLLRMFLWRVGSLPPIRLFVGSQEISDANVCASYDANVVRPKIGKGQHYRRAHYLLEAHLAPCCSGNCGGLHRVVVGSQAGRSNHDYSRSKSCMCANQAQAGRKSWGFQRERERTTTIHPNLPGSVYYHHLENVKSAIPTF